MQIPTLRPTFAISVECPKSDLLTRVSQNLATDAWQWVSRPFDNYIELHIPKDQIRFWSPHLSLSFDERDGATWIHGRFAPRQEVWTLVWIAYLAFAFGAFFSFMFALSASLLQTPTWAGYMAVLFLLGIGAIYAVSYLGQKWSHDQMEQLRLQCNELLRMSCSPNSIPPSDSSR